MVSKENFGAREPSERRQKDIQSYGHGFHYHLPVLLRHALPAGH